MLHYVELIQVATSIKEGPLSALFLDMAVFPFLVVTDMRQGYLGV